MSGCGTRSCSDCDGNYPAIASAFTAVPDNFNSVTNFVPKIALYRTLQVVDKAVENTACGRGRKCFEGAGPDHYSRSCRGDSYDSYGFIGFPLRVRTDEVKVCGKATCQKDGYSPSNDCLDRHGRGCPSGECQEALLGYVSWPKFKDARDVRTCGPIETELACRRRDRSDRRRRRRGCNVVVKCDSKRKGCCGSTSSSGSSFRGCCGSTTTTTTTPVA